MNRISTYWKCQLFGWGIVSLIIYTYNNIIYPDYISFLYKTIIIFLFGITCSHLLRTVIKKLKVLYYPFINQVILLGALNLLFSCATTFIWLYVLIKSTIYNIPNNIDSPTPFYKVYIFNLLYVFLIFSGWILIYFLVHYVKGIREQERKKLIYEYKIVELEAKALRAQMNPHFIFNCMNSIKALIQKGEQEKSVLYLLIWT
jgi:two-component system LytT family sensor kinase